MKVLEMIEDCLLKVEGGGLEGEDKDSTIPDETREMAASAGKRGDAVGSLAERSNG